MCWLYAHIPKAQAGLAALVLDCVSHDTNKDRVRNSLHGYSTCEMGGGEGARNSLHYTIESSIVGL
jgi:hypothetical protein